ncbi:MAG: TIGR03749 family integrating conjugative element protein [Pseudomonadota bacterium]
MRILLHLSTGLAAGMIIGLMTAVPAFAEFKTEILRWNRAPLSIHLPIGQERYVWFPGRVQPGVPPDLISKLRVQAVNDTIYLQASEPFETTRLPVRDLTNGDFYLFDITTSDNAPTTPVRVVNVTGNDEQAFIEDAKALGEEKANHGVGYLKLTRFAAQQSYAPERLIKQEPGIHAVPLPSAGEPVNGLLQNGPFDTVPVASWRSRNGLYVTSVRVRNRSTQSLALDPRSAVGQWLTATFHHHGLAPAGDPGDTSMLYLISDRPFLEALVPWRG